MAARKNKKAEVHYTPTPFVTLPFSALVDKRVAALRGRHTIRFGRDAVPIEYVLFDDRKTYLHLEEQSAYDYHDASASARELGLVECEHMWAMMYNQDNGFAEPTDVGPSPF